MTEYRGISGTYSDFKLVKTRGVVQVIVEFPIEEANQVLESLEGLPMPGLERYVSIGLRNKLLEIAEGQTQAEAQSPQSLGGHARAANLSPERREEIARNAATARWNPSLVGKKRYAEADEMEQARTRSVLLARDPQFQTWVYKANNWIYGAADFIRVRCGVQSRREIATDRKAYVAFLALEQEFLPTVGRIAENRG
jgi:hypothetical protein